jgi:Dolichyl-phosphate-mannose-protein mannosyltransferase
MQTGLLRPGTVAIRRLVADCSRALWPAYLLASFLILWGFTWSLPDYQHVDKSFHADENAAVWAINQIHFPGFNPHLFNWGTALFYQVYLLKLLVSLGGMVHIGDPVVLLLGRAVVWASAMGILTCTFLVGRDIFDAWTGRLAAMILAVLPGFAINSHYLKTDIPMTLWALAAMFAGYRLLATRSAAWIYALGLLTGYAISTKYNAATMIPAGLVFLLMSGPTLSKVRALSIYLACLMTGFLLGTPRVLPDPSEFLNTLRWVREMGKIGAPGAIARGPAWSDYLTRISQLSLTFPMWITATGGALLLMVRRGRALLPVWVFLAAYTFLLSTDNSRLMRYAAPLLPFAALFVAGLVSECKRINLMAGLAATIAVCVLIAYASLFTASYIRVMTLEDPRLQAGRWIAEHAPRDVPFPVSTSHYLGAPQVQLWGYQKLEIETAVEKLRASASPYLAVSEYVTERYEGALGYFPTARTFFDYVRDNYTEVTHFENSQRLLGVDSKTGLTVTHDWLYPNPRITIYRRKNLVLAQTSR